MESVRFLASLFALEFEPRTYLPSLETRGHDVPIGHLSGDIALPEAEATPEVANLEIYAEKYPVAVACPAAPPAQIVIPAADPLHDLRKFDESPFSTLFSVVPFEEEPVTFESVFPTLSSIDLDMSS